MQYNNLIVFKYNKTNYNNNNGTIYYRIILKIVVNKIKSQKLAQNNRIQIYYSLRNYKNYNQKNMIIIHFKKYTLKNYL